jgi:hypothetical protein
LRSETQADASTVGAADIDERAELFFHHPSFRRARDDAATNGVHEAERQPRGSMIAIGASQQFARSFDEPQDEAGRDWWRR